MPGLLLGEAEHQGAQHVAQRVGRVVPQQHPLLHLHSHGGHEEKCEHEQIGKYSHQTGNFFPIFMEETLLDSFFEYCKHFMNFS